MTTCSRHSLSLALTALALSCTPPTGQPLPPPPAGAVVSFTVTPTAVANPGDQVSLTWQTQDATEVTVAQVGGAQLSTDSSGTAMVAVTQSTVFLVTARGPGGTDARAASVTVPGSNATPPFFAAVPATIDAGGSSTLVWTTGASSVTLGELGGASLGSQGPQGSLVVRPGKNTTYELTVEGVKLHADVAVRGGIFEFRADGAAPLAGGPVTLRWRTGGGSKVTITREGASAALLVETDAAKVAEGSFIDTAPVDLVPDGVLTYQLQLEAPTPASASLVVHGGGTTAIKSFTLPGYALSATLVPVLWTTTGGDSLQLFVDGQPAFVAQSQGEVNSGSFTFLAPPLKSTVELVVKNRRGSESRKSLTVETVGLPTFTSFTSDKASVAQGGVDTATLSWSVANARHVRIVETGGALVFEQTGHLDTGSTVVSPNHATSTYVLTADNGVGPQPPHAIAAHSVSITVGAVAALTFDHQVPTGAVANVTGSTLPGGGAISGLPIAEKNVAGDAFVDIAGSGTDLPLTFAIDGTAQLANVGSFSTVIFGRRVTGASVSVNPNGWMLFSPTAFSFNDNPTAGFGTTLEPLAIAPYWQDLYADPAHGARLLWQVDTVGAERRLIVQWQNVELFVAPSSRLTFQAQVYSSGRVIFAYRPFVNVPANDNAAVGVVNGSETAAVLPPTAFSTSDVYRFFGTATLPAPLKVENTPYVAHVSLGAQSVEVEGSGRLVPGRFAITEANPFPAAAVTNGEWVELTNFTNAAVDLGGWVLEFGSAAANKFSIPANTTLPANGRLVFGQASGSAETATVDVVYGTAAGLAMVDASGSVALSFGGAAYSRLSWGTVTRGVSVVADAPSDQLAFSTTTALQPSCAGAGAYGANGQLGTPGAGNARCFQYVVTPAAPMFESIAATGTMLVNQSSVATDQNDKVFIVTLPSPAKVNGASVSTLYVSTNGFISPTSTTVTGATNSALPSTSTPATLAPFWDDLKVNATSSGLYWQRKDPDGTPATGDEYTLVSWENFALASGVSTSSLSFQVKLFDVGHVEYQYAAMGSTGSATAPETGTSATTWLKNAAGDAALVVNANSATPGIAPNTGWRFTYTP